MLQGWHTRGGGEMFLLDSAKVSNSRTFSFNGVNQKRSHSLSAVANIIDVDIKIEAPCLLISFIKF